MSYTIKTPTGMVHGDTDTTNGALCHIVVDWAFATDNRLQCLETVMALAKFVSKETLGSAHIRM